MVYAHMVRSPYAHARIKSINTDAAKEVSRRAGHHHRRGLGQSQSGLDADPFFDKQMVLATGKVFFQAQEVAFVVAEDRYAAADAAELVEVDYEELPVLVDPHKARCRRADAARRPQREEQSDLPLGSRR